MTYEITITERPTNSLVTEIEYELVVPAHVYQEWGVDRGKEAVELDTVFVQNITVWVDDCGHEVTIDSNHRKALERSVLLRHREAIEGKVLAAAREPINVED